MQPRKGNNGSDQNIRTRLAAELLVSLKGRCTTPPQITILMTYEDAVIFSDNYSFIALWVLADAKLISGHSSSTSLSTRLRLPMIEVQELLQFYIWNVEY